MRTTAALGQAIRERRQALGLSQAAAARAVGVSRQWVGGVERGARRAELGLVLDLLVSLGLRLNVTVAEEETAEKKAAGVDLDALIDSLRDV